MSHDRPSAGTSAWNASTSADATTPPSSATSGRRSSSAARRTGGTNSTTFANSSTRAGVGSTQPTVQTAYSSRSTGTSVSRSSGTRDRASSAPVSRRRPTSHEPRNGPTTTRAASASGDIQGCATRSVEIMGATVCQETRVGGAR
ncbi:Uncharacterised protein [Mycobacteroides abscessus]|nr:Uncharacterised protein [Mycobacteroides abscessus]